MDLTSQAIKTLVPIIVKATADAIANRNTGQMTTRQNQTSNQVSNSRNAVRNRARRRNQRSGPRAQVSNAIVPLQGTRGLLISGASPRFVSSNQGITRLSHTECLGTITSIGEDGDTTVTIAVSCKMTRTMSEFSQLYHNFKIISLSFDYGTTCTTATQGRVVFVPWYDHITQEAVVDCGMNALESCSGAVSCSVWEKLPRKMVFDLNRQTTNNLWFDCHPGDNTETILGYVIIKNSGAGDVDIGKCFMSYVIDFGSYTPPFQADLRLTQGYYPPISDDPDALFRFRETNRFNNREGQRADPVQVLLQNLGDNDNPPNLPLPGDEVPINNPNEN
jgi:hypothetical protein